MPADISIAKIRDTIALVGEFRFTGNVQGVVILEVGTSQDASSLFGLSRGAQCSVILEAGPTVRFCFHGSQVTKIAARARSHLKEALKPGALNWTDFQKKMCTAA